MSEKVRVVIPPEKMAEIQEKYNLTDEALKGILEGVHVVPAEEQVEQPQAGVPRTTQGEEEMTPQLFRKISSGEFTMVDYLMWSDMQDRREERKRRIERDDQAPKTTPETIGVAVVKALKDAGVVSAQSAPSSAKEEEMPPWAKKLEGDMAEIKGAQKKEEEEKRLKETVNSAVKPLEDKLEKETEERKHIEEKLKEEKGKEPPKSELDKYIESKGKLEKAGIIKEPGGELPAGTPGEVTLATKTIDKGEKILTKGMDDMKDTLETVLEFQVDREKRLYKGQTPPLPKLSDEEKLAALQKAAGEPTQPSADKGGG